MMLEVGRGPSTPACTIGSLFVDGQFECFTLEDVVREKPGVPVAEWKIPNQTVIPSGTYTIIVNMSDRFQRLLPLLLGVPRFDGVRIHSGNIAADTEGCILVGQQRAVDAVNLSRLAFDALFPKIQAAVSSGETIQIRIVNP